MELDHGERKRRADEKSSPEFFYTYILQFEDDGTFYVGSTNNPAARWTEHAVGVGAVASSGRRFTVRLVHQFLTRKEAEYNEDRIKGALSKGPVNIEAMIDNFSRISSMIRPEKTFSQLREEEESYIREMERVFHYSKALVWNPGGIPPTACGWKGQHYGTDDWDALIQQAAVENLMTLNPKAAISVGRKVCRRCLALAPQATPV